MSELLKVVTEYLGDIYWITLFAVAILYLCLRKKDFRLVKNVLLIALMIVVFILNPISFRFITAHFIESASYYRFFWPVPYVLIVAVAAVRFMCDVKDGLFGDRFKKLFKPIALMLVLVLVIPLGLSRKSFVRELKDNPPANKYEISQDVMDIAYILNQDKAERSFDGQVRIAYPLSVAYEYPSYDASVISVTSRNVYYYAYLNEQFMEKYEDALLFANLCTDGLDGTLKFYQVSEDELTVMLLKAVEATETDYLIVPKDEETFNFLEKDMGYTLTGETPSFYVLFVERGHESTT